MEEPTTTAATETPVANQPEAAEAPAEPKKKSTKEVPEWKRPEVLAKYDAETIGGINTRVVEIDAARNKFVELREDAKEAKREWEALRDALTDYAKERKEGRGKPVQKTLLDFQPGEQTPAPPPPAGVVSEQPAAPSRLDSLWREYPLARLTLNGATDRDIEVLAAGERKGGYPTIPVRTIGELADYSAGDGTVPRHITDFKGLGPTASTRVETAVENFWGWWNKGGRDEFAREMGVLTDADDATAAGGGGEAPGDAGGPGDGDGQPAGDAEGRAEAEADPAPAEGEGGSAGGKAA